MTESGTPTRTGVASEPVWVRFGRFELREADALLVRDGKGVDLAPTPFAVLCALVREPGSLRTKNALLDEVWGHRFVTESVLKTVIRNLRLALGDDARDPRIIETVSRRGYRFIAPVTPVSAPMAQSERVSLAKESSPAASFIGREEALTRLQASWSEASAGKRRLVWVAGEPGIGKTSLIERFAAGLGDALCVRGQCVEQHGAGEPYLPVLEALGELCRHDGDAVALLRAVAPAWLLQLPWLATAEERESLRRELAGSTSDRMMREVAEAIDRYTERRPLLLVTEDLHWSDRATIQLMDHLARRRGSARFMWLASFRTAEVVAADHPLNRLRRELRLHGLCEEIALDPFSEKEVGEYIARLFPAVAAEDTFIRTLHARTEGLPLFVAQVAEEVLAAGRGMGAAAADVVATMAVPENIVAMIEYQIARLPQNDHAVLSAAAVCGVEFATATVADALGREHLEISEACTRIVAQHIWLAPMPAESGEAAEDPRYRFRHSLLRQVLYERIAAPLRMQLHHRVACALERHRGPGQGAGAAELADHFERAGEMASATRYYVEAAAAALHLSPEECIALAEKGERASARMPAGPERQEIEVSLAALRGVAAAQLVGMASTQASAAFEQAYRLLATGDAGHRMQAMLLNGFGLCLAMRGEYEEALAVAQRAGPVEDASHEPLLTIASCIVRAFVLMLQGRPVEARESIEETGLAALGSFGGAGELSFIADPGVTLLALLGLQLLHLGRVRESRERLNEAHARAQMLNQPMARVVAMWIDGLCDVRLGNAERVAALADEMQRLVEEFALTDGRNASRWLRGWAQAHMGDPRSAHRMIREACDAGMARGAVAGASENLGYAAEALLLAGDADGAQAELDRAFALVSEYGERVYLPQLHLLAAAIAKSQGDAGDAKAALARAVAEAQAQRAPWLELLARTEVYAHAPSKRDHEALAALVAQLAEARGAPAYERARSLLGMKAR